MWLFSYGSNGREQLSKRLGRDVKPVAAFVEGYRRVFRGHSQTWGGGVASLEKHRGGTTYGSAARVTEADLRTLDRFEGVGSGKYRRVELPIMVRSPSTDRFERALAVAYLSTSKTYGEPTKEYLEAVARNISAFWSDGEDITWRSFPLR
jgi:cation transport regulator ChaC